MTDRVKPADFQQLTDQVVEPLQFVLHRLIKVGSLFIVQLPKLQRFQVQLQGGDRRLQFVSHAVDEVGLPLVQANFFHRQKHVEDHADQDQCEDDRANGQNTPRTALSQQDDPADHQRNVQRHHDHAQRDRQTQRSRLSNVARFGCLAPHAAHFDSLRQKVNPARQIVTLPVAAVPVHVQSRRTCLDIFPERSVTTREH